MKLESLNVKNFRCFTDITVDFDPQLTVFVGVNGAGKTAILDALGFFLDEYAHSFYSNANRDNIPQTYLRHGHNEANLNCTICWDDEKIYPSIILTRKVSNPFVHIEKKAGNLLKLKNEKARPSYQYPVVAYYSGKRELDSTNKLQASQSSLTYAYQDAFKPQISFSSALAWFIEKASQEALEAKQKKDVNHTIPELSAVRVAVAKALGEFDEPFVGETPPVLFIPCKKNTKQIFRVEELSDGYRIMLALVMDFARRMAVANQHIKWPDDQSILYSPGIVLIDEVDLHLHPSWQQTVLPSLMKIFPNTQFIVTTHSPQVLTSIEPKHIRILENGRARHAETSTYGAQSWRVLKDILDVPSRPSDNAAKNDLDAYFTLINAGEGKSGEALRLRKNLDIWLTGDPTLDEADMLILRKERAKARAVGSNA